MILVKTKSLFLQIEIEYMKQPMAEMLIDKPNEYD